MESRITLSELLQAGILSPNTDIVWRRYSGVTHKAKVTADGQIEIASGEKCRTPTAAARMLNGDRPVNGWMTWRVGDKKGPTLSKVREQLLQRNSGLLSVNDRSSSGNPARVLGKDRSFVTVMA